MHPTLYKSDVLSHALVKQATVGATDVALSVIIPNFNTAEFVLSAMNSVLSQTFKLLEVIVVDDGSTDHSLRLLEGIDDSRLTIVTQSNRGLAGARNTGILLARGKYIGFLDSDDIWYPQKAERQLAIMDANPAIGLTFSYSAYLGEDGSPTGQLLISRCMQPTATELAVRNHVGNGSTPIIRRECFEEVGMFEESLKALEDQEMWIRIAADPRWKVQLIPEVLTGYRVRSSSLTNSSYSRYVAQARLGIEAIRRDLPDLPQHGADRCYAEFLRIMSRKALSNGDVRVSRSLMSDAIRLYPWLVFRDVRAIGLLAIHVLSLPLPRRFEMSIYRISQSVMRRFYAILNTSAAVQSPGGE